MILEYGPTLTGWVPSLLQVMVSRTPFRYLIAALFYCRYARDWMEEKHVLLSLFLDAR